MGRRIRWAGSTAAAALALGTVWAGGAAGTANASTAANTVTAHALAGNFDFVGTWGPPDSGGWVITSEDPSSGACAGTSDFSGYGFTDCQVSGNNYKFTVTDGPGYSSYNTGTIEIENGTPTAVGSFTDTNGTTESYSVARVSGPKQSATEVLCNLEIGPGTGQMFLCTAVVADASGSETPTAPTGNVTFAVDPGATGGLPSPTCALQPSGSGPSAFCSVDYDAPTGSVAAGTSPPVTATYQGDDNFDQSAGAPSPGLDQAFQAALLNAYDADASDCQTEATGATSGGSAITFQPMVANNPGVQFQPTDSGLDRAAKVCALPIRGVLDAVGGLTYGAGATLQALGSPAVAGTGVAAGAAGIVYGGTTGPAAPAVLTAGAVTFVASGAAYYVGAPVGNGLAAAGSALYNDPPDSRYRTVSPPTHVTQVALPPHSAPALVDLARLGYARDVVLADAHAMQTAVNRAGGAALAHATRWVGIQTRAALADGRLLDANILVLQRDEAATARAYRSFARTLRPLSAHRLAVARRAAGHPLRLPAYMRQLLAAFGITPADLRATLRTAVVGDAPARVYEESPYFTASTTFMRAASVSYSKVPEIVQRSRLH